MSPNYHHYITQLYDLDPSTSEDNTRAAAGSRVSTNAHVAQLNLEMQQSRERTQATTQEVRPKSIKLAYYPKMSEFCTWCDDKGFPVATRYQVNGDKLHLFLETVVSG